jgi:succinyl-CoA synthetase alpha subunit
VIVRRDDRVLVQGITGRQGTFWTERMIECGTRVVGGVSPKRAGGTCCGVPVFASAEHAAAGVGFDVAVMFIPPAGALAAAQEAIKAGAKLLVVLTEHIPAQDTMALLSLARRRGTRVVGPNTAGLVTPGEGFVGIMPAFNPRVFRPGKVGVVSRSGSLGTLVCLELTRAELGQSAFVGIGGDPLLGTTTAEAVDALAADPRTEAIVVVGEIGGAMEEAAAAGLRACGKPAAAFIAGRVAPPNTRMGHAGAIVTGEAGSYRSKRAALEAAGVAVCDTPGEVPGALLAAMAPRPRAFTGP